jgi:hypothetical protein
MSSKQVVSKPARLRVSNWLPFTRAIAAIMPSGAVIRLDFLRFVGNFRDRHCRQRKLGVVPYQPRNHRFDRGLLQRLRHDIVEKYQS